MALQSSESFRDSEPVLNRSTARSPSPTDRRPPRDAVDAESGPAIGSGDPRHPRIDELPRPPRTVGLVERCGVWLDWFGFSRLIGSAAAVAVIVAGMWWLLRAPPIPPEQALPHASGSGPAATLAAQTAVPPTAGASGPAVPTTDDNPSVLYVHVAGNVAAPGVYRLPSDARVADAVSLAGGVTESADSDGVNLAAPLHDGERIYVPAVGEVVPGAVIAPDAASGATTGDNATETAPGSGGPVDVNTADQAALETLPGVGPATARSIIEDRTRNGPFASVDDLERVPGIGPAKLASLRDLVAV